MLKKKRWRSAIHMIGIVSTLLSLVSILLILHSLTPSPRPAFPLSANLRHFGIAELQAASTLGPFGKQMLEFARHDLPFTIFIPTPSSFQSFMQAIGGISNSTSSDKVVSVAPLDERNLAVISRIFGFSTAPLRILSSMIPLDDVLEVDSLSGLRLTIVRSRSKGIMTVNNLACRTVDMARGSIIIHLVDGVLMDSEFEGSVMPFRDGEEEIGV